ncbi:hypothetical protein PAXRUDRAFT_17152 [Paxillus rubicundulus Ve08.2h10]|uniref:Uncharacterized protein n=1 Tax=Paxillus rubicundulus Ve08.2h10 TaxID=930991 RepID=A0A0D0DBI5_9AGAM|nr:hypothetical protein PAXRUDRAFT_17152 [Paxillus rubicundulus Ve08.2h10]
MVPPHCDLSPSLCGAQDPLSQSYSMQAADVALANLTHRQLKRKHGKKPATSIYSPGGSTTSTIGKRQHHSAYQVHRDGSFTWTRQFITPNLQVPAQGPILEDIPLPSIPDPVNNLPPDVDLDVYNQQSRKRTASSGQSLVGLAKGL